MTVPEKSKGTLIGAGLVSRRFRAITSKRSLVPALSPTASLWFLALHIPLAIAFKSTSHLATAHAVACLIVGIWIAMTKKPFAAIASLMAYIVGSEALWRMTGAAVVWEFGKYSVALVAVLALSFQTRRGLPLPWIAYWILLVPGALLTLVGSAPSEWKDHLSFNLSGQLCLAASGTLFVGRRVTTNELRTVLLALLAPLIGVATLTLAGLVTTEVEFGASSSLAASGGFGPNQVSAALGLGAAVAFLLALAPGISLSGRILCLSLVLWLGAQAALTLSRSGLYYAAISIGCAVLFLRQSARQLALGCGLVCGIGLGAFLLSAKLDAFTEGALSQRFDRTDLAGRETLIQGDLVVFLNHPILGVGVGLARRARAEYVGVTGYAHTEFTRLLSEHGLLGMAALSILCVVAVQSIQQQRQGWPKAISSAAVVFAFVFMSGSATRMSIPGFLIALSGVNVATTSVMGSFASRSPGAVGQLQQRRRRTDPCFGS